MKNKRMYGIIFKGGSNCGIAQITVLNNTTGKYIDQYGNSSDTLVSRLVDTYFSSNYSTEELTFCYWISLEPTDEYDITVSNSGTHHPLATSPYNINIVKYLEMMPVTDARVNKVVRLWHTDFESDTYDIVPIPGQTVSLEQTSLFSGDGTTDTFVIGSNSHAYEFIKCSVNGGTTWMYPNDPNLTWGGNSPLYNDDTINTSTGRFGVIFDTPPLSGTSNVMLVWKPKVNTYKLIATLKQPEIVSESYVDNKENMSFMDFGIELIP